MTASENLHRQLTVDLIRLHNLVAWYIMGHTYVKQERDQLAGAIEIKLALLQGLERAEP